MINKINKFNIGLKNRNIFGVILISSLFIIALRVLAPVEIQSDQNLQIEAAYRLIQGLGYTIKDFPSTNLNDVIKSRYLFYPPSLSLLVAFCLSVGLSLATSLKLIYALSTMIGWFGWAIVSSHFLKNSIRLGQIELPINYILAAILPIFYTPSWSYHGTDIFLWAIVPFLVIFLLRSVDTKISLKMLVVSGLLFGLAFSFRYASLFLAFSAFLILGQINFPQIFVLIRNYFIFICSSMLIVFPVLLSNKLFTLPGAIDSSSQQSSKNVLVAILDQLPTISVLSGLPARLAFLPRTVLHINYLYGILCLFFILICPILIFKSKKLNLDLCRRDISISISLVVVSLVLFLIVSVPFLSYESLGNPRYHTPVNFSLVLIIYELLILNINSILRLLFFGFISLFLIANLVYRPATLLLGQYSSLSEIVLGIHPVSGLRYPSNNVYTRCQSSHNFLRRLSQENTNAIFLMQNFSCYRYDNPPNFVEIPNNLEFWRKAYVSRPSRIFWVVDDQKCIESICFSKDQKSIPILNLSSLPNYKVVYFDRIDRTRVLVSDLPVGYHFKVLQ
jgi:hypothetical protein